MGAHWPSQLYFYMTPPHECSYLPPQQATTLLADPSYPMEMAQFNLLSEMGFRRSGDSVYAPRCRSCNACLPVRVVVERFRPNRSQRRNLKLNRDITLTLLPAHPPTAELQQLYQRYITTRHSDGGMANDGPNGFTEFFLSRWCDTLFLEFRLEQQLIAVSVIDQLQQGLSAVYTFFDPEHAKRGLGTFAVLQLIELCRQRHLPWLYLGYLIHQQPKMAYKRNFQPYQLLVGESWVTVS
ncbi:arginyltransferase [Ectothiorhodospiraceae bacterium BW-2]|nr:arginyltransferase [Ectothiorhodospiraceae bacterium BW-2]